ncbi:hypothetical protein [Streptomyces violascens]|uniref:hypothetical protein n=1 Tax=Streptomyces violascens TaxID=67381 RepID=UPI003659B01B
MAGRPSTADSPRTETASPRATGVCAASSGAAVTAVAATPERGARLVELGATDLATLVRLVEAGRLHPEIGSVRDWSRTAEVIADLRARKVHGNAVLTLS